LAAVESCSAGFPRATKLRPSNALKERVEDRIEKIASKERIRSHRKNVAKDADKPVFKENVLAKLLEAAYVVQEHLRGKQAAPSPAVKPQEPAAATQRSEVQAKEDQPAPPKASETHSSEPARLASAPVPLPPAVVPAAVISSAPVPLPVAPAPPVFKDDYATTLAQIVETQRQLREFHLDLKDPMAFIAERVCQIARAGGAAVGILEGENIRYRAAFGSMAPSSAEVPKEKALCAVSLQTGQVMRCSDVDSSVDVDMAECRRRGIRAMITVPAFHDGAVAGGLELYYAGKQAFTEQDVHTAQLVAGLVTEALAREEDLTRRKSLAGERALMLAALEKLQPNLAALVDASAAKLPAGKPTPAAATSSQPAILCAKCGHELLDEELFCGKCGSPRGDYQPPSMQSKVASMLHMQDALKKLGGGSDNGGAPLPEPAPGFDDAEFQKMLADSLEKEMPELFQTPEARAGKMWPETPELLSLPQIAAAISDHEAAAQSGEESLHKHEDSHEHSEDESEDLVPATALAKPERNPDWSSAASAREFLEQLAGQRSTGLARFWQARRGDFYLALAVILVAVVIRWGIWSNHAVSATGTPATAAAQHRKAAPDADLSWFDRTLVKLGLAEAPEPVEYKGNPQAQVWVDLRTALYYCPGADLYGKTPKGKFTTQRDAQLDQFEPAYRKACD
jgi:putative methionine-R-sulfoxide reductase with GAF domain